MKVCWVAEKSLITLWIQSCPIYSCEDGSLMGPKVDKGERVFFFLKACCETSFTPGWVQKPESAQGYCDNMQYISCCFCSVTDAVGDLEKSDPRRRHSWTSDDKAVRDTVNKSWEGSVIEGHGENYDSFLLLVLSLNVMMPLLTSVISIWSFKSYFKDEALV